MQLVGVDLAWGARNRTGLAAVDLDGNLVDLAEAHADEQIVDWLGPRTAGPCLVAIDAPLVVTNPTGSRACEAELNRDFRRFDAGAHPSNTSRPEFAGGSRALRLAEALDLAVDPSAGTDRRAVEVYPHPASVVLFGLDRTIKYKHKPGRGFAFLQAESTRLLDNLERLERADPPLRLRSHARWTEVRRTIDEATRKADLRRVEDVVDAVLCAYVALVCVRRSETMTMYGDAQTGYIVTPRLPPHVLPPHMP